MKTRNLSDDVFIHKLLEETYNNIPEEEQSLGHSDLKNYFEMKNEDEPAGEFKMKSFDSFYRLEMNGHQIDFPKNWSFFSELDNYSDYVVTSENDHEDLIDLLAGEWGKPFALLFSKNEDGSWWMSFKSEAEYWDYFNGSQAA